MFPSAAGREAVDLAGVPVAVESKEPARHDGRRPVPAAEDTRRAARMNTGAGLASESAPDPALVEALRAWRRAEAQRLRVPAHCVLPNRTLEGIARVRPTDLGGLLGVKGVGPKVVERYGAAILARVRASAPPPRRDV